MIKLRIEKQNGTAEEVEVEEYDAAEVESMLNTNEIYFVAFGDQVFRRIDITHIKKIKEV